MIRADFYNYLQHGVDFLVDGTTHVLKKIVVHTNVVRVDLRSSDVRTYGHISSLGRPCSRGTNDAPGKSKASLKMTRMVCTGLLVRDTALVDHCTQRHHLV